MKSRIYILIVVLSSVFPLVSSCDKQLSCKDCQPLPNTKAPIAVAGPDQVLNLPVNFTDLNGRSSYDYEGRIVTYRWTKIAGPTSYNIVNPNVSLAKLNSLVAGAYEFQLEVTDLGGLYGYDSMKVTVN